LALKNAVNGLARRLSVKPCPNWWSNLTDALSLAAVFFGLASLCLWWMAELGLILFDGLVV